MDNYKFPESIRNELINAGKKVEYADTMYNRIVKLIEDFESTLNPDEISALFISGYSENLIINDVGFQNPYLMIFYCQGDTNSSEVQIIQHVSQVNLCLVKAKRSHPDTPRRQIGFCSDSPKD